MKPAKDTEHEDMISDVLCQVESSIRTGQSKGLVTGFSRNTASAPPMTSSVANKAGRSLW